jgi:hypothetical protein
VITIQSAMLVALGFFAAAFIGFLLAPLYRRRAARLATDEIKQTMPLTTAEIRADKDRLRAEYALTIHRLEMKVGEAAHAAAKQMVEINRRDAGISALEGAVQKMRTALEEHENARRVLEQTITDRLPKVEYRLAEAKKLLFQRDREISGLTQSANKQTQALEEATQINAQQRDEIHRLNATLAARAARNRETLADPRFDGEVALRSEIEALRAKTRDQTALISRLQGVLVNAGARPDQIAGLAAMQNGHASGKEGDSEDEIGRLRKDLADAEVTLKSVRGVAEAEHAGQAALEAETRALKAANEDQAAELAKLRAALKAYEAEDVDERTVKESKIAMRARLSALQAQAEEQTATIQRLRAEMAAANEKLARQAAHFMDEMRRLGAGTLPPAGATRRDGYETPQKRSLVERISAPRAPRALRGGSAGTAASAKRETAEDPARVNGFLRALDGASEAGAASETAAEPTAEPATAADAQPAKGKDRRAGLLERITRMEKPAASGG